MYKAAALKDLQSKLGKEVHISDWIDIKQENINKFADATFDHQWIHVDVERARKESPFGGPIAHGYYTLSLIPYLAGTVNPDAPSYDGVVMGINYGTNRVRFPHAVPVGCRVRSRTKLLSVEDKGNSLQVINEVTLEIEGVEKPGCVAETVSRMYFSR